MLLLHGSSTYANDLLQSNAVLPLRMRRLDQTLTQHRSLVDSFSKDNDTDFKSDLLPLSKHRKISRADASTTTPTFDETTFNQSATTACADAVNNYTEAINPSGLVACYNVAAYDNATGVFQTDVRLYQKSAATGSFEGLVPSNLSMSFSIAQATLSNPMMTTTNDSITADSPAEGQFVMGFQNIGQLSKSITFSKLTE